MMRLTGFLSCSVKYLTLLSLSLAAGCSLTRHYVNDPCKSRAYIRTVIPDYVSTRFQSNAPVRVAIVPFSVPANVAGMNNELPGLGNDLAWKIHERFVDSNVFPIVEVFNRQDWPRKKEEFHTGNFGAIASARDAGYDLVFVGNVDPMKSLDELSATTKLIETESGTTVWFGQTTARSEARNINKSLSNYYLADRVPSTFDLGGLEEDLSRCIVREVTRE